MLNHHRGGSGEPLVLLHGIGSQWQMWQPVIDRLATQRDVVAVDLPGFGASPALAGDPSIAALAAAVCGLIDALGLDRPHVAGNSLGGGLALELARRGWARTATALSPIGFARGRERPYAIALLTASHAIARGLGGALDGPLSSAVGRAALQSHLLARPWRIPAAEAIAATHNLARSPGFDATLPHVIAFDWHHGDLAVPATIGWGTRDWLLIPRQARRARRLLPAARHVWLRGCGHVPTWDDPDQVAALLLTGSCDA